LAIDDGVSRSTLSEVASIFARKSQWLERRKISNRQKILAANRDYVFEQCGQYLNQALGTIVAKYL
jgi:hypothetical protein